MEHAEEMVIARPTAIALKCETPVGLLALMWEEDEDTGRWVGTANMHCTGNGELPPHIHSISLDELVAGIDADTGDPVSADGDNIMEAAAHMVCIAVMMQSDFDMRMLGELGD